MVDRDCAVDGGEFDLAFLDQRLGLIEIDGDWVVRITVDPEVENQDFARIVCEWVCRSQRNRKGAIACVGNRSPPGLG